MTAKTQDFTHRYIPAKTPNAPTLLMLHGTGGDENSLLTLASAIYPEAAVLSPRGMVMEGAAPRFFRRLAEGVFDMEDLVFRTHELADWLNVAVAEYGIAPEKLVAVGYSNGANIAASLMFLRPEVLKYGALLRPMLPLTPEIAPDLSGAAALVAAGSYDPLIPTEETARLIDALKLYGANVTVQTQPTDHRLTNVDINATRAWILQTV